jgi:hypothetical protein
MARFASLLVALALIQSACSKIVDADALQSETCSSSEKVCVVDGRKKCVTVNSPMYGCGQASCNPCAYPHAIAECSDGDCAMGNCAPGFGDCNANPDDGCEVDLYHDTEHCGDCDAGESCSGLENAMAGCRRVVENARHTGKCAIQSCERGYKSCDGSETTGCETHVLTDKEHCGSCDTTCDFDNAEAVCEDGGCVMEDCKQGFEDCNLDATDGCEARLVDGGCPDDEL